MVRNYVLFIIRFWIYQRFIAVLVVLSKLLQAKSAAKLEPIAINLNFGFDKIPIITKTQAL
jgi:type III secretory pathway component EscR